MTRRGLTLLELLASLVLLGPLVMCAFAVASGAVGAAAEERRRSTWHAACEAVVSAVERDLVAGDFQSSITPRVRTGEAWLEVVVRACEGSNGRPSPGIRRYALDGSALIRDDRWRGGAARAILLTDVASLQVDFRHPFLRITIRSTNGLAATRTLRTWSAES